MSWPILAAILENSDFGAGLLTCRLLLAYEDERSRRDSAGVLDVLVDMAETAAWNSEVRSIAMSCLCDVVGAKSCNFLWP